MSSTPPASPEYQDLAGAGHPQSKKVEAAGASPQLKRDPTRTLDGDQAEAYCRLLESLIRGGRPNSFFPSGRSLENLVYLLRPSTNRGLANSVRVNLKNGLPDEPEIGRIIADKDICRKLLRDHDVESVRRREDAASRRLVNRLEYYRDVDTRDLPERFKLDLKLKRIDEAAVTADFIAVFERFDPGEGIFTRYTIHLRHTNDRWSKPKVELQGDDLRYTEGFRNVISRYSSHEAEFAYILLSDLPGIEVEEITRGRIGPLWMQGVPAPAEIEQLLAQHPGNAILNFPFERVFRPETDKVSDGNRDPFAGLYRESLQGESRLLADERAEDLGYVVHKERKFACTKALVSPLREVLSALGKPCVVYPGR